MSISKKPKDFQVLFFDMDSFFASVEQQVQPSYRGKPLGVAPYTGNTGCIIAASKEAKKIGIKTGFLVGEAKKVCPQIKVVEARPALYMIYHKEIKKVLSNLTPFYQPLSVDEFLIKLSPSEQNHKKSLEIGYQIKQKIKSNVGDYLTCSVGISSNQFLAKMASKYKKPDGLFAIKLQDLKNFYQNLRLRDLTGINFQMEKRLNLKKIQTPLDLYQKSLYELVQILGHWGRLWYFRLRGYEIDDFKTKTKNIGHSHVLAPELRDYPKAQAVLKKLVAKIGYRLRKNKLLAQGLSINIKFVNQAYFKNYKNFAPVSDTFALYKYLAEILKKCSWQARPLRLEATSYNLVPKSSYQINLFDDFEKQKNLARALDNINDKYGAETLGIASAYGAENSAPDRIPFGKPRYDIFY